MARGRDVQDGWGGEEDTEAHSVFEGRSLEGRKITLTITLPPLALPEEDERAQGSVAPPSIDPRNYDAWTADRLRRSSLPPKADSPITPLPPAVRVDESIYDTHAGDDAFALVSRSTATLPTLDLVAEMAERFALDDFTGSLRAAELLLGQDPTHPLAQHYARETQAKLESHYRSRLDAQGRVPRLVVAENEVRWLGLDAQVGPVLAHIDGTADYDQVVKASGMPKLVALRTLVELVEGRVVRLV